MSGQPSIQSGYNSFESYSRVNATIDDRPGLLAHALVIRIRSWKDVKIRNRNNAKDIQQLGLSASRPVMSTVHACYVMQMPRSKIKENATKEHAECMR
jgi:hypothetical protein